MRLNYLRESVGIRCRWLNSCQKKQPKTSTDSQVTSLLPKSVDRRTQHWWRLECWEQLSELLFHAFGSSNETQESVTTKNGFQSEIYAAHKGLTYSSSKPYSHGSRLLGPQWYLLTQNTISDIKVEFKVVYYFSQIII